MNQRHPTNPPKCMAGQYWSGIPTGVQPLKDSLGVVAKNKQLRLHNTDREVELLDPNIQPKQLIFR